MSVQEYEAAKKILTENPDSIFSGGGCTDEIIMKAEEALNLVFPDDYKLFLKEYGILTFNSDEIYGIVSEDFYNSGVPDAIWYTLSERKEFNFPHYLLVIYDTTMGEVFCLNYQLLNKNEEPKITSYYMGFDEEVQTHEVIADSFGDFLLKVVTGEIWE